MSRRPTDRVGGLLSTASGLRSGLSAGRTVLVPLAVLATWVALVTAARPVTAYVPDATRTLREVASVNRASGRAQALQFELTMRVGTGAPIASGELISHPSGLARLELRGYAGRIDRYLLTGNELLGAKDGQRLDRPQPMLQPLFLMQPSSEITLRAALETFGVQSQWIGLAPCGEQDCFVFGDPRLSTVEPPLVDSPSAESADQPLSGRDGAVRTGRPGALDPLPRTFGEQNELAGPSLEGPGADQLPRLWVDTKDLQVRRIDRADGVFTILGPIVSFEKLRVPAWFEVHEPGGPPIRFDVDRVVQVNAPPKAFSRQWLLSLPDGLNTGAPAAGAGVTSDRNSQPRDASEY